MNKNSPTYAAIFSYEEGGMVGPGGIPQRAGLTAQSQPPPPIDAGMMDAEINRFTAQHPEQVEQIKQAILQAIQSGELTDQELNMVIQLATVAAQNPQMYPHVRKFAIQQGIATEQDLPMEYDSGLVFVILLAAKAVKQGQGTPSQMPKGTAALPSMASGGPVPEPKNKDGSVVIRAHENEYVVPKHVVLAKGTEFFDRLVQKYDPNNPDNQATKQQ